MKLHVLMILAIALGLTGCSRQEEPASGMADESQAEAEPAPAEDVAPDPDSAISRMEFGNDAVLEHMHRHADNMDEINFALADGDLDAAVTQAQSLSRYEQIDGIPEEWLPYLEGMREGSKAIAASTDLTGARAAAKTVTAQCQGCHKAAGIVEGG